MTHSLRTFATALSHRLPATLAVIGLALAAAQATASPTVYFMQVPATFPGDTIKVKPGTTFAIDLLVRPDGVATTAAAFTLSQVGGLSVGGFKLNGRSFSGSIYDDPSSGVPNSVVLAAPGNRLGPTNAYNLGRATKNLVGASTADGGVVVHLSIAVDPLQPLGLYRIATTNGGASYLQGSAPDLQRYDISGTSFDVVVGDTVNFTFSGTGDGSVAIANIVNCGSLAVLPCGALFVPNQPVSLVPGTSEGSHFVGYTSGPCKGSAGICNARVTDVPGTIDLRFDLNPNTLVVHRDGSGAGTIRSTPNGISCGTSPSTCVATFDPATRITLTAGAKPGSRFAGWSGGGCFGIGACAVTTTVSRTVTAVFTDLAAPPAAIYNRPGSNNFGDVGVGTRSPTFTFTVGNSGATGFISKPTSSNSAEFAVTGGSCMETLPHRLQTGETCTLDVAFTPAALGPRSATINSSTDGVPDSLGIRVTGNGIAGGGSGNEVSVVEYHHAGWDQYFITASPSEQAVLGEPPFADWQPTGLAFNGYAPLPAPAASAPVCRFFNATFVPKSAHFYALPDACDQTLAGFPDWQLETRAAFNMLAPDASGACPAGSLPVYRLYNDGQGGAPNHRFVTSLAVRQQMIDHGWVAEGSGIGVAMCSPL